VIKPGSAAEHTCSIPKGAPVAPAVLSSRVVTASLNTQSAKKMKLVMKHTSQHNQTEADSHRIRSDITNYLQYVPGDDDDDPLVFRGRGLFPSLQHTAKNSKPQCIVRACGKYVFHSGTTT